MVLPIFEILNFIVIIGLLVYLFKAYALGALQEGMQTHEKERTELFEKKDAITGAIDRTTKAIQDDARECKDLKKKVVDWADHIRVQDKERAEAKQRHIEHLKSTMVHRIKGVASEKVTREVLPMAVKDAQKKLEQDFVDAKLGGAFLEHIFVFLEKEQV